MLQEPSSVAHLSTSIKYYSKILYSKSKIPRLKYCTRTLNHSDKYLTLHNGYGR